MNYWTEFLRNPMGVVLPLVMLLTAAVPTAILWYRDRRIPAGHCRKCGYDLTGNVSGICPECGRPIEAETKATGNSGYLNTR